MDDAGKTIVNALSIDVEEYFQVSNFDQLIDRRDWETMPSRVDASMTRILDDLDRFKIRATFFFLGWLARRKPELVRRVHARGHEIASHGMNHELVYRLTPEQFRDDVGRSKEVLEQIIGQAILGYRAPSYSITRKSWWALEILAQLGFAYDSSIFPIRHHRYGIPGYQRFPHHIELPGGVRIWEFPISTVRLFGFVLPVAGGAYLRFLPGSVVRTALRWINRWERCPVVVYYHPWETDPNQPRQPVALPLRINHYFGIPRMNGRLRLLFRDLRFAPISQVLGLSNHDQSTFSSALEASPHRELKTDNRALRPSEPDEGGAEQQ